MQSKLLGLLRAHGRHSLAWSILQPGMSYFECCGAVIAYQRRVGHAVVLGDPVCAPDALGAAVSAFVAAFPRAIFMQAHAETIAALRAHGFHATPVGVENELDTATFDLVGKRKADLRHYRNKATRAGIRVAEEQDTHMLRRELAPVSNAWLPLKSGLGRELTFLARPFVLEPEPEVRIFTARIEGRVAGFVVLDPMFDGGVVRGYTVSILRHLPDAPEGATDYINLAVINRLRAEGVPLLSLGVSPFRGLTELARAHGRGPLPEFLLFHALYRFGDPIYHFRGLTFHKSRYRARELPVFAASRARFGLLPLFAASRACGML